MEKIILLGSGGHAKSVADAILQGGEYEVVGFVDNTHAKGSVYCEYRVIGSDDDLETLYNSGIHHAFVCVGYLGKDDIRGKLYKRLKEIGFRLPVIVDPSAILAKDVMIGEGTFIGKGAIVNACVRIGEMAIINSGALIEHDCVVGAFSHVAVGSVLCGEVQIGNSVFIGAGATVIQCVKVGANAFIGIGSVVVRDIPEGCTAVGVPAKVIKKHE